MPSEKLTAYLNLVKAAEQQPFARTEEGLIARGLVAGLVWSKIQAREAGLTPSEIWAAIQIGEHRNPSKANPPPDTHNYAPYDTESYWEAVYREALAFWASQESGVKKEP